MPAYGPYETTREIASGHGSIVYSARKAGETRDTYAVKVFSLDALIGGDEEAHSELDPLVEEFNRTFARSVELQRKAAEVSRHVAPILEVGREPRLAWYATRLYPRTVDKILEGRVALSKEWFFHIVSSVARGALDFKRTCGRAHGDLRPSNILISASQKVRDAEVVLSDPLPGDTSEGARYEAADLNAIGHIIFQLVRRRQIEDASVHSILPLMPSEEWTSIFGKDTNAWLSLCNRLLDPNLSLDSYSLEKLEVDLAKLQPRPLVTGKVMALAAVGLVLLSAGVVLLWPSREGTLFLTSEPSGAQIQINGELLPERTPLKLTRPKASYSLRAEYPGLDPQTATVNLQSRRQKHPFVFPHGIVVIDSQPQGAAILIGGTNLMAGTAPAVTPHTIPALKPGSVQFDLRGSKDYLTTNVTVDVRRGETHKINVPLPRVPVGEVIVEFDCNPYGGRIYLDGKLFTTNSPDRRSLRPDRYHFTARYREGWPEKQVDLTVRPGGDPQVKFYFERGRVILESEPPGAKVYASNGLVTNLLVGVTPTNYLLWPAGVARFRFEAPGYEDTDVTTNLLDNGRINLAPRMISTNGVIELTVNPVPAILIDAQTRTPRLRTLPGVATEMLLPQGAYPFIIQPTNSDYQSLTTSLAFVRRERKAITLELMAKPLPVVFTSDPPDADLFDSSRNRLGKMGSITTLPAGRHTLHAFHPGHTNLGWITKEILVSRGGANSNRFSFPYATLVITSTPPGVMVTKILDSGQRQPMGATPLTNDFASLGRLALEFVFTSTSELKLKSKTNLLSTNIIAPGRIYLGRDFEPERGKAWTNSIDLELIQVSEKMFVARFETTQEEFKRVVGTNISTGVAPATPVTLVSWSAAQWFCQRLNENPEEQSRLAAAGLKGWTYRLPSVADWGIFGVAGLGGLAEAIFNSTKVSQPLPVDRARKTQNKLGIYDLYGNVAEWCQDAAGQPTTLGGGYSTLQAARKEAALYALSPGAPAITNGGQSIGFRCVLKAP